MADTKRASDPITERTIRFLTEDFPVIREHPVPFVEATVLMSLGLWVLYRFQTRHVREELDRYKTTRKETAYSVLSNRELRQQALDIISRFRSFIANERRME